MQHIIFGAGLVGGYLYGVMQHRVESVAMVARPAVKVKLAQGLTVSDYQGHRAHIAQPVFTDTETAAPCRYLWLTLKCTALHTVLDELVPFIDDKTVILCCQNGLGSDQLLKQRFPQNAVKRVVVMFNVTELTPGHLHRGSQGQLYIENHTGSTAEIVAQLDSPLLPVRIHADMQALSWSKLQVNLANAVNALADIPMRATMEQRDFRRCIALLMEELLAVAAAKGISLTKLTALPPRFIPVLMKMPDILFRLFLDSVITVDPTVRTSMWWDIHEGRLTEVDYLNGAVVNAAQQLGLECRANRRIVALIHALERGERQPGISARKLLQELRNS